MREEGIKELPQTPPAPGSSCHYLLSPLTELLIKPRILLPDLSFLDNSPFFFFFFFQQPFPKKFPFSEFVPKVYSQIKEFIYACLKFSEDLHLRWGVFATERGLNGLEREINVSELKYGFFSPLERDLEPSGILVGSQEWFGLEGNFGGIISFSFHDAPSLVFWTFPRNFTQSQDNPSGVRRTLFPPSCFFIIILINN